MEFICAEEKQWKEIKTIYMEAFPKRERKPYFALRHSVKTKKAVVMAATEGEQVLGFIVLIPYKDMVRWRRYCRRIWYRKEYGILKLKIYINIGEKWIYRNEKYLSLIHI